MTFTVRDNLGPRLAEWLNRCQAVVDHYHQKHFANLGPYILEITGGTRYIQIRESHMGGSIDEPRRVWRAWAFIDVTNGDILRPKTYKQPAAIARGNIFDNDYGMSHIGPYGPHYIGQLPYSKPADSPY